MRLAKMMMAVAACSLAATPVLAAPAASKLSVSASKSVRGSTTAGESNEGTGGFIIPAIAIIAIILGILVAVDEEDEPQSP
ncbi:hypothetical protein [Sphingomonas sp. LT1P40]|uniref:hypothetical protein n=1 Tax=Alteristakelama amylovorans TaxID=3096166 RepID=UPI002FC8F42C